MRAVWRHTKKNKVASAPSPPTFANPAKVGHPPSGKLAPKPPVRRDAAPQSWLYERSKHIYT